MESLTINKKYFPLLRMSKLKQAYYLGYDIRKCSVNDSIIFERFEKLTAMGMEEFIKTFTYVLPTFINQKNTLESEPSDYFPTDVMWYQEQDKNYFFSRAELKYLLRNRINPYTRTPLPDVFLDECESLNRTTANLDIPECEPITDMFEKLLEPKPVDAPAPNIPMNVGPVQSNAIFDLVSLLGGGLMR